MKRTFGYRAIKKKGVKAERETSSVRDTERLIIETHTFKTELKVPNYPALCPENIFKLIEKCYKLKAYHAISVCFLLTTQLQRPGENNTITLEQTDVMEYLGISAGAVSKAFTTLENLKVIAKIGKSRYKISPAYIWVGNHIDWAEEVLALQENREYIKEITEFYVENV